MNSPFVLPSTQSPAISWDDALAAVLGYARCTRELALAGEGDLAAETAQVPDFAYRAYDCVPAASGSAFTWLDVLVVDSLNGKLNQQIITALTHAADRAWPHVERAVELADGRCFWELHESEVVRNPAAESVGGAMWRAWAECYRTPGVKVALTHKLLHHKRPELFPLIDNRTSPRLNDYTNTSVGLWAVVHRELSANRSQFTALEDAFACQADGDDDVALKRLRLHDILLWLVATGKWTRTVERGRATPEWERWSAR